MSAGKKRRERKTVDGRRADLLKPFLRYSAGRDAWVLKVIGNRFGPVYRIGPARVARPGFDADLQPEDQA